MNAAAGRSGLISPTLYAAIRARHFSPRTEETYAGWIRRFLASAGPQPEALGEAEIGRFLSGLATDARIGAASQNQALAAILFLYQHVLGREIMRVEGVVRAKRGIRVPVVLSRGEVLAVLNRMSGTPGSWRCSSTARACASSSAANFGSRTSTSR